MENNNINNVYKNLEKQKKNRIIFVSFIIILMVIMATVGIYFIVFDKIDSFLDYFQAPVQYETISDNNGFSYTIKAGNAYLTDYTGNDTNITIPSSVNEIPVSHIESINNRDVVEITIPDSVIYIENYAFYHLKKLKTINGGENISTFGEGAFKGCTSLENITFYNSLHTISLEAFCNTNLKEITIPPTVNFLDKRAFNSCRNLKKVDIGAGVYVIEDQCFKNCKNLTDVYFHGGTISLETEVFTKCHQNLTIYCKENSDMVYYCKKEGIKFNPTLKQCANTVNCIFIF